MSHPCSPNPQENETGGWLWAWLLSYYEAHFIYMRPFLKQTKKTHKEKPGMVFCTPLIPVIKMQSLADPCELEGSLVFIVGAGTVSDA